MMKTLKFFFSFFAIHMIFLLHNVLASDSAGCSWKCGTYGGLGWGTHWLDQNGATKWCPSTCGDIDEYQPYWTGQWAANDQTAATACFTKDPSPTPPPSPQQYANYAACYCCWNTEPGSASQKNKRRLSE